MNTIVNIPVKFTRWNNSRYLYDRCVSRRIKPLMIDEMWIKLKVQVWDNVGTNMWMTEDDLRRHLYE